MRGWLRVFGATVVAAIAGTWAFSGEGAPVLLDPGQTPEWSDEDLEFYLHGSISDEWVPERVLRAFAKANPDLFPNGDLSGYGAIGDGLAEPPIGFSRREVEHLGGLPSWGLGCAACHSGRIDEAPGRTKGLVLSMPGTFDVAGYFGAILVSMERTRDRDGLGKFLTAWVADCDPAAAGQAETLVAAGLERSWADIQARLAEDTFASKGIAAGELHAVPREALELTGERLAAGEDVSKTVWALYQVFHNMRVALHVPEPLPAPVGTVPGPGRADAFVGLANGLLGIPKVSESASKIGVPWELEGRRWLDWDGNAATPLSAHVAASLSSGAPMTGGGAIVDFENIKRFRALSETIRAPKYPFAVDAEAAKRGGALYEAQCARCHEAKDEDARLVALEEIGTDPNRARMFGEEMAKGLDDWLLSLKVKGFEHKTGDLRSTGKYFSVPLAGVWARAPYLHNGSVRTMRELLLPAASRARTWKRGSRVYVPEEMGFANEGTFTFDTAIPGNANSGHEYGATLTEEEKRDLMEYLKTR